jgi:hypothetical protein
MKKNRRFSICEKHVMNLLSVFFEDPDANYNDGASLTSSTTVYQSFKGIYLLEAFWGQPIKFIKVHVF